MITEQQKIEFRKLEDLPSWPKAQELADLQARIDESTRRYEAGEFSAERYWPSLARMEAREAELKRERRQYEGRHQARRRAPHSSRSFVSSAVYARLRADARARRWDETTSETITHGDGSSVIRARRRLRLTCAT